MLQPGARSRIVLSVIWLLLGALMIAVAAWLGWTRGSVLVSGHPALLLAAIVCAVVGVVAVLWAAGSLIMGGRLDREVDANLPRRRTPTQMRRRARNRILLAVPALALAVLLVGAVAYARPLGATPVALAAMVPSDKVRVDDRITWYEMSAIGEDATGNAIVPTTGLVFVPGARVDPRAYAHLLRPLAEAGYLVAVVKPPMGFSIVNPGSPQSVLDLHTEIRYWALAGHSLGGTTAAMTADANPEVDGLVLFGSYPAARLTRTDLKVTSVFGSEDGLVPLARIEQSKEDLPRSTRYVEVPGAAHSWFGDYGEQPGDNPGSGDRAAAQAAIVEATKTLLAALVPPPPKKK